VHFARATLEGVAFSARHLLEAIEEAAGLRAEALRASGGGARSDLWCQIKADVCGCEIRRLRVVQSGALGAALLAGKGAGVFEDLREAAARAVHVEATFRPRATEAAVYEDLYGIYRGLYPALKPSFQQLSVHRAATALTEKGVDSDRVRSDRRARAR
jgi:xylulokinase